MSPTPGQVGEVSSRLARKLGLVDAVVVGLGSMIGAGIFAVIAPAAEAAGSGLIVGLFIAGAVAYCNALSSARLASMYPESGGAYVYGRRRLGNGWGFLAGWGFIWGKLASCAAMALTFANYAAPEFARPLAAAAVLALTAVNYFGIQKTALLTRVIVAVVIVSLAIIVATILYGGEIDVDRLRLSTATTPHGILQAAGLWFFAFAGYARLATLGEEVRDPARIIPVAIPFALAITLVVYGVVAVSALLSLDIATLATSQAPLAAVIAASGVPEWTIVVRVGAAVASLGVLLSLIAGVSRTIFSMSANGDLLAPFAAVHPRYRVPHRAELAVGLLVAITVLLVDVSSAIGFSAFTVLVYYAITNAAALTLRENNQRWSAGIALSGLAGCAILAFSLPLMSVLAGSAVLLVGVVINALRDSH